MKSLERLNRFLMRRSKKFCFGKIWDIYPTLMKKDPSEGIRSDEIIPIIKTTFKNDVNIRYFNGSILFYALDDRFYQNYDPNSKTDIELLDTLITIEKSMIDLGEIPPIFAHIVAHKS